MLEVIVFALVLVIAQLVAGIGICTLMLSNWFTKKMMKKTMDLTKQTIEMMEEEDLL